MKFNIYITLICLLFVNAIKAQRFETTIAPGGNSWESSVNGTTWSANSLMGDPEPTWQVGQVSSNLKRGASAIHAPSWSPAFSNFIWATPGTSTGQTTFYRFKFDAQLYPCKQIFLQVAGDDEITVEYNGIKILSNADGTHGEAYSLELTEDVKCGLNEVLVSVKNTTGNWHYFVGVIDFGPEILTLSQPNITTDAIKCGSPLVFHAPDLLPVKSEIYTWSGPNNFQSNSRNPVIPYPTAKHSGTYTCRVEHGCCVYNFSITIVVPDCDQCIAVIDAQRVGCGTYKMSLRSDYVDIQCFKWQIDGKTVELPQKDASVTVGVGHHEVCAHYFGPTFSNKDILCCHEVCYPIDIEAPTTENKTEHYCPLNNNKFIFNPCNVSFDFENYTFNGPGIEESVMHNKYKGCEEQFWGAGNYVIQYFDEYGCLIKTINLTIVEDPIYPFNCYKKLQNPCFGPGIDPNTVMPDQDNCLACYLLSLANPTAPAIFIHRNDGTRTSTYKKTFINMQTCSYCEFVFDIEDINVCVVEPSFTLTKNSDGSFTIKNTSTSNGTITLNNLQITPTPASYNASWGTPPYTDRKVDLVPGMQYTFCITVNATNPCWPGECVKTRCFTVQIGADGNIESITEFEVIPPPSGPPVAPPLETPNPPAENSDVELIIYPNPANSIFHIMPRDLASQKVNYSAVTIRDISGRTILVKHDVSSNMEFDLSDQTAGIYFIEVIINGTSQNLKLTLE